MVDIHSHILPGIDDGSRHLDDTLEMVRIAAESGVKAMVATPHCNMGKRFENYFDEAYIKSVMQVRDAVRKANLPVMIYPGTEAYATWDLPDHIADQHIMTLNQSHYLLMEFDFREDPAFADSVLERVKALGVKPVIAHVERYEFIQDEPQIISEWRQKGYCIQVNKGSILGKFGENAEYTANTLLEHRLVNVIASDAHSPETRTPYMLDAYEEVCRMHTQRYADLLFKTNPRRICADQPIMMMAARPFMG